MGMPMVDVSLPMVGGTVGWRVTKIQRGGSFEVALCAPMSHNNQICGCVLVLGCECCELLMWHFRRAWTQSEIAGAGRLIINSALISAANSSRGTRAIFEYSTSTCRNSRRRIGHNVNPEGSRPQRYRHLICRSSPMSRHYD